MRLYGARQRPTAAGFAQLTPVALTATAFYNFDACTLGDLATVLGCPADAKSHRALVAEIRAAFNRKFFNAAAGTYATSSQTANARPLVAGLAAPRHKPVSSPRSCATSPIAVMRRWRAM